MRKFFHNNPPIVLGAVILAFSTLLFGSPSMAGPKPPPVVKAPAPATPAQAFTTEWKFEADYLPEGVSDTDANEVKDGPIRMPAGFAWACMREPVRPDSHGTLIGGWECRSGTAQLFVRALCYHDKQDVSNGQAGISATDDQRMVHLSVWCQTTPTGVVPGSTPGNTF